MIWEVDTNLNGYISYDEYERMYKRCVVDKKELEPKKLYTLIQFLMLWMFVKWRIKMRLLI